MDFGPFGREDLDFEFLEGEASHRFGSGVARLVAFERGLPAALGGPAGGEAKLVGLHVGFHKRGYVSPVPFGDLRFEDGSDRLFCLGSG